MIKVSLSQLVCSDTGKEGGGTLLLMVEVDVQDPPVASIDAIKRDLAQYRYESWLPTCSSSMILSWQSVQDGEGKRHFCGWD